MPSWTKTGAALRLIGKPLGSTLSPNCPSRNGSVLASVTTKVGPVPNRLTGRLTRSLLTWVSYPASCKALENLVAISDALSLGATSTGWSPIVRLAISRTNSKTVVISFSSVSSIVEFSTIVPPDGNTNEIPVSNSKVWPSMSNVSPSRIYCPSIARNSSPDARLPVVKSTLSRRCSAPAKELKSTRCWSHTPPVLPKLATSTQSPPLSEIETLAASLSLK